MKEEQNTPGFSFQLSASAPPAEVVSQEPREGGLDPLEPGWFALSDPTLELDLPTRTPAPVSSLEPVEALPPDPQPPAAAPPQGSNERLPTPAVKRITFPRAATTVFSDSVSQAPRVQLPSTDEDATDDDADGDAPLDLPLTSAPPSARSSRTTGAPPPDPWRQVRRWALQAAQGTSRLAHAGGTWALTATRTTGKRAAEAWSRRRAQGRRSAELRDQPPGRPLEPTLSGEEVAPIAEETPRPPSVVVERMRPVLPALAALGAAGACYLVVATFVPTPAGSGAHSEETAAADVSDPASPPLLSSAPSNTAAAPAPSANVEAAHTEQLPLPDGLSWPGKGLIEVVTGGRELIYVDGVFTGRGPLRLIPVAPGQHEVVLRTESSERKHVVDVTVDRRTRLALGGGEDAAPDRER